MNNLHQLPIKWALKKLTDDILAMRQVHQQMH